MRSRLIYITEKNSGSYESSVSLTVPYEVSMNCFETTGQNKYQKLTVSWQFEKILKFNTPHIYMFVCRLFYNENIL